MINLLGVRMARKKWVSEERMYRNRYDSMTGQRHPDSVMGPDHTSDLFHPKSFYDLAKRCAKKLTAINKVYPFEAIAGTGHSSLPMLGAISFILGVPLIAVRKSGDIAHDDSVVNGFVACSSYVFVDDLIDSGTTLMRVKNRIEAAAIKAKFQAPTCIGALLYNTGGFDAAWQHYYEGGYAVENKRYVPVWTPCGNNVVLPERPDKRSTE